MLTPLSALSLRAKLLIIAAFGAGGTLLVGGAAHWILVQSTSPTGTLASTNAVQRAQMDADMMHDGVRGDVYRALLARTAGNSSDLESAKTDLGEHGDRLTSRLAEIARMSSSADVQQQLKALAPSADRYLAAAARTMSSEGAARGASQAEFDQYFSQLETEMEKLGDTIQSDAAAAFSTMARAKIAVALTMAVMLLLTTGVSLAFERQISGSLKEIMERTRRLQSVCITNICSGLEAMARGDLSFAAVATTQPLTVTSANELGMMAQTVNDILGMSKRSIAAYESARTTVQRLLEESDRQTAAAHEGRLGYRSDEQQFDGSYRLLISGSNRTLDAVAAPIAEATAALERLAQRDLTARVSGNFAGDHATIQRAFNSAVEELASALGAVSDTAASVAAGAAEIDAGSQELAQSSSDQAAALEEIAASARELSAMTKRNAESSTEGRLLAQGARESTASGVTEVQKLAEAIEQIRTSAEATARIVKTIDEIAFQTNLLALNAAVEAARAGDSGRGFAVVADEVRSLALRSAEAARSTADLIDQSVKSTTLGVAISNRVLAQLGDIETRVSRVGQVVSEIAAASEEQAKGVELIDTALDDMARRTQAVAATADQSKAASESLTEQSAAMHELVSAFELGRSAATRVGAGRPARRPVRAKASNARNTAHVVPAPRDDAAASRSAFEMESGWVD